MMAFVAGLTIGSMLGVTVAVLREFAEKVIDSQIPSVHPTYEEAITEYAAKLRLAGENE